MNHPAGHSFAQALKSGDTAAAKAVLNRYAADWQGACGTSDQTGYKSAEAYDWVFCPDYPISRLELGVKGMAVWMHDEILMWADEGQRDRYADMLGEAPIEDAVVVGDAGGRGYIWDGWHRCGACAIRGVSTVPAVVGIERRQDMELPAVMDFEGIAKLDSEAVRLRWIMDTVTAELLAELPEGATATDINNGNCEDWAETVLARFGAGETLWLENLYPEDQPHPALDEHCGRYFAPAHCVFRHAGRYYDSVHRYGCESPDEFLMPVPPVDEDAYISSTAYNDALRGQYFSESGEKIASSRMVPLAKLPNIKDGSWRMDQYHGAHGRAVDQLRTLPLDAIELKEADWTDPQQINYEGRKDDAYRYAAWLESGREAPPVEVVESFTGRLRLVDGHRRVAAARLAGQQEIRAWVSPVMPHPENLRDSNGNVQIVGMTYEAMMQRIAACEARHAGGIGI